MQPRTDPSKLVAARSPLRSGAPVVDSDDDDEQVRDCDITEGDVAAAFLVLKEFALCKGSKAAYYAVTAAEYTLNTECIAPKVHRQSVITSFFNNEYAGAGDGYDAHGRMPDSEGPDVDIPAEGSLMVNALLLALLMEAVAFPCVSFWALFGRTLGARLRSPRSWRVFNALMGALTAACVVLIFSD